jgi:hypothetical protein
MPYLDSDIPYHEFKKTKRERRVLAKIYTRYVKALEDSVYPDLSAAGRQSHRIERQCHPRRVSQCDYH